MRDAEVGALVADAIERFANRLADELTKQASMSPVIESDRMLRRAAAAVREAGKSPRTWRREAREAEKKASEP